MRCLLLLALLAPLASGCDSVASSDRYDVTFADLSGAEVGRAEVAFDRPAAGEETAGTYRPLSGQTVATSETLRATGLADGSVTVDLDQDIADGGASLSGPFSAGVSVGAWVQGTIAGPRPAGTFQAVRQ